MNYKFILITALLISLNSLAQSHHPPTYNPNDNFYSKLLQTDYGSGQSAPAENSNSSQACDEYIIPSVLPNTFITDYKKFFGDPTPNSICRLEPNQMDKILKSKGKTLDQAKSFQLAITNSEVLIAGELHLYTDLKARTDLISTFRKLKGQGACVAFELPNINGGMKKFLQDLNEQAKKTKISGDSWAANEQYDFIKYYKSMDDFALSSGLKTFPIDHPENFVKEIPDGVRNQVMANNIDKLIKDKKCGSVLLFVGKAHETPVDDLPAISTLLKNKSRKTTTVNIQMTHEKATPFIMRTWESCDHPSLDKAILVNKSDLPKDTKLAPKSEEKIKFTDYDFTFFIPEKQRDFPCFSCVSP